MEGAVPAGCLSVAQVVQRAAIALAADPVLSDVWVAGEISNFTHHSSGHMYFTLKDEFSRLRAVMFRGNNVGMGFRPSDGMMVYARGRIGMYEKGGDCQLYVDHMEPVGLGALFLAFQQLRAKLDAEGLFDPALKRPIPRFVRRIGVVTSPTGAAVRDIITVSRRRHPGIRILVVPALVQGVDAPASIVRGIELANAVGDLDALIVGRGGGSMEELWAFNDELVARAIRASRVPVVSAVGHETDFTIADFAADLRAPTPSAAAELVVPDMLSTANRVEQLQDVLSRSICRVVDQRRQEVDELSKWLSQKIRTKLQSAADRVGHLSSMLAALDPGAVLGRGYAICRRGDGAILRSAESATVGEDVSVTLGRGALGCEVKQVRAGA